MSHQKWNLFMMAYNEEEEIEATIQSVKNQTIPPNRIFVLDDGSTDSTGVILDKLLDINVTHLPAHRLDMGSDDFWKKRNSLMIKAAADSTYMVSLDADTVLLPDYVERIVDRMEHDSVMVAGGTTPNETHIIPGESGLVINAGWFLKTSPTPMLPAANIVMQSLVDGYRSIVYRDIKFSSRRKTGVRYNSDLYKYRGIVTRKQGLPFQYAVYRALQLRSLDLLKGYVMYDGEVEPEHIQQWFRLFDNERLKVKIGLKSKIFEETDIGTYIIPITGSK